MNRKTFLLLTLIVAVCASASYTAAEAPVFYAAEQYYAYKHGVYNVITELDAKNMIREKMLPGYTKLSQITDAEGQWKMQIQRDVRELDSNPYIINVKNGLYNVLEDRLTQHDERYLSTVQLNVNYTPGADCPRFRQFLHESLSDDQVVLIQEMLGYFLIPVNRAQKSFVIVGEAGAGKSKLLLVLNDILLGKEIKCGCRIIKNKKSRFSRKCPCDPDPLLLSA